MTMVLIVDTMIQVIAVIILTTTKAAEATARMTGPIVVMATVLMDVRLVILLSALQKIITDVKKTDRILLAIKRQQPIIVIKMEYNVETNAI